MKYFLILALLFATKVEAHVPSLLLPLTGTPITSYFLGQSNISRAIYSEITAPNDFFVAHFYVDSIEKTRIELLTPVCDELPRYEKFQPSVIVFAGDIPWKSQAETNPEFIARLEASAVATIGSNFSIGNRPRFYEEFAKMHYWVGGIWTGSLQPGLYSLVVFDRLGDYGNFTVGLNEKEAWTPDLYSYVGTILPQIQAGICSPQGFSGRVQF